MTILVTGGAGYVGVQLCRALLNKGHKVILFDNFIYGTESILSLLDNKNIQIVKGDIRGDLKNITKSADVVFHLAAISGFPACAANKAGAISINVDGTKNLIDVLSPEQLLVYASTTSVYGAASEICDESAPTEPLSLYGQTKLQAEKLVMERQNSISFRFATIFGVSPRMRTDLLINEFVYRALQDRSIVLFESKSKRTFLHILDAVKAYSLALDSLSKVKGKILNVGDEKLNFSKFEIAQKIKDVTGCTIIDSAIADLDRRDFVPSFQNFANLGFSAEVSIDEGIDELVRLYKFYSPHLHFRPI